MQRGWITTSLAVLVIISVAIGFLAGRAYQVAHRAWADYKKTKALVPELLKAFWAAVRGAIVILAVAFAWMVGSAWAAEQLDRGSLAVAVVVIAGSITQTLERGRRRRLDCERQPTPVLRWLWGREGPASRAA